MTDEPTLADRFEHPDGTEDRDAIRRASRPPLAWWGRTSGPEDGAA